MDYGFNVNHSTINQTDESDIKHEEITDIDTGDVDNSVNEENVENIDNVDSNKPKEDEISKNDNSLVEGTIIEIGNTKYTVDKDGNVLDDKSVIFKQASEVKNWLDSLDKITEKDNDEININNIIKSVGVDIVNDNNEDVVFENTPEGINSYINAVLETGKEEQQKEAIDNLFNRYPFINDAINYYVANGNSLDGFGVIEDRSKIEIDSNNEEQQEYIIKTAWKEQNRKGDVDNYIQYLKSSGLLFNTAKEELIGLQEADNEKRKAIEEEAIRKENERTEELKEYWNGVHDVIKSREIAGYKIPESIVINRDGKKLTVTPNDFFNYLYRVDKNGKSEYQNDLAKLSNESRRNDSILRAFLTFTGGNYSNLVEMAINKEKVETLRFKAKENNKTTARITRPNINTNKKYDFGIN